MNKNIVSTLPVIVLAGLITGSAISAEHREMPKEDVIDVPAIGEGLCVHNLFQSNMLLRLDDLQRQLKEAQTFIDVNKEKYEKDRAAFEKEQAKARERLEKANK